MTTFRSSSTRGGPYPGHDERPAGVHYYPAFDIRRDGVVVGRLWHDGKDRVWRWHLVGGVRGDAKEETKARIMIEQAG